MSGLTCQVNYSKNKLFIDKKESIFSFFNRDEVSVHFIVNKVRLWNTSTNYFLTSRIIRNFSEFSKKRLKNIIIYSLHDNSLWLGKTQQLLISISNFIIKFLYFNYFSVFY